MPMSEAPDQALGDLLTTVDAPQDSQPDRDDTDRKTLDHACHRCGQALSAQSGVLMNGRKETSGICPDCRLDGIGAATFVTLADPSALSGPVPEDRPVVQSGRQVDRLQKRQRGATPQSTSAVAAFIDDRLPAGQYVARRTDPMTVTLTWSDDTDIDQATRLDLTKRLKARPTNRRWFVQSFPSEIRLVDQQVDDSDELAFRETIPGRSP